MRDNLVIRLFNNVLRTQIVAQKKALTILLEIGIRGKSRSLTELEERVPVRNGDRAVAAITTFPICVERSFYRLLHEVHTMCECRLAGRFR